MERTGVLAKVSVAGVMEDRKYGHTIRSHKFVYEALMRPPWIGFLKHARGIHYLNKVT